ncbi:unnamed protein product [Clonostachys rosea]|uniref:Uncharacterized protein n=1 Tax=Bionectria ochroleuca TaxID=29856 RepID=A0ABY6U2R1_BIOOC|nr:unnamed protein product [Clonostachys rosea]
MSPTSVEFRPLIDGPASGWKENQGNAIPLEKGAQKYQFRGLAARRRSRKRVWINLIARWLVTVLFVAVVYILLIGYSKPDLITRSEKRYFYALFVGFTLALGIVTVSQLNNVVNDVEAIMNATSMSSIFLLAFRSKRISIHISVLIWLLLIVGSQVAYSAVGLTFGVEKTEDKAMLVKGQILIPDMSNLQTDRIVKSSDSLSAQQYTANTYGTMSLAFTQATLDQIPNKGYLWFPDDPIAFCDDNSPSCTYIFHEKNAQLAADPGAIPVQSTTNRSVEITSQCNSYPVIRGANGTMTNITINAESKDTVITLPTTPGSDQSLFMTRYDQECGPNCRIMSVFEVAAEGSWYYSCTTFQGPVKNATLPQHEIGENVTYLAATAIGLQGFASPSSRGTQEEIDPIKSLQYKVYPSATVPGKPANGSTRAMEGLLSRFAIGVIAMAAESNSGIALEGRAPQIGQKLGVEHWNLIHMTFALTAGLQLLLAIGVTLVAERVIVPDGGPISEAQIFRAMTSDRGVHAVGSGWRYRFEPVGTDGLYDLYMEEKGSKGSQSDSEEGPSPPGVMEATHGEPPRSRGNANI